MRSYPQIMAKTSLLGLVATAASIAAVPATALSEFELAQSKSCFVCHRGTEQRIGPPFKDIAEKYAGQKDAKARLAAHIINGTGPTGQGWLQEGKAKLPFMPANGNVTPEHAARLAAWILGIDQEIAGNAKFITENVSVSGLVERPLKLGINDLRKFPIRQLEVMPRVGAVGTPSGKREAFRGVLLREILEKAGIAVPSHFDLKKMVIIASASDGYKVVFSWSEVFKSPIGDGVMLLLEKNGQPLTDDEGRIGLVSTQDASVSSRYVKWLKTIEVRKIVD